MIRIFAKISAVGILALAASLTLRSTAAADANSREGCMNQWLFNGVWRVRVTKVEPWIKDGKQQGWLVTEVWRNGTDRGLSPADSVYKDQRLELSTGSITATETTAGTLSQQSVTFNSISPAGEFTYSQVFAPSNLAPDPNNKPKGLQVIFDGAQLARETSKPQFTTSHYNFHYNLGCVATGAAAQAQGGSTQISATEGCMKQWMSNGIWRMRVTSIGPQPTDVVRPQDQYGWRVYQEWVNITGRPVWPGALPNGTQPATNVTDEYLVTQGGVDASSANVAGGMSLGQRNIAFAPGVPYAWNQLFGWGSFNAADKPVRLLVTFDAKKQNAIAGYPHYRMPANFRINLECTK